MWKVKELARRGFKIIGVIYQSWKAWDGDEMVSSVPQDIVGCACSTTTVDDFFHCYMAFRPNACVQSERETRLDVASP